jgi:hypothetical protein
MGEKDNIVHLDALMPVAEVKIEMLRNGQVRLFWDTKNPVLAHYLVSVAQDLIMKASTNQGGIIH